MSTGARSGFAMWFRVYDKGCAPSWIVGFDLDIPCAVVGGSYISAFPQSRAIVDDFGRLVLVEQPR